MTPEDLRPWQAGLRRSVEKVVLLFPSGEVSVSCEVARLQLHVRLFDHEFNEWGEGGDVGDSITERVEVRVYICCRVSKSWRMADPSWLIVLGKDGMA